MSDKFLPESSPAEPLPARRGLLAGLSDWSGLLDDMKAYFGFKRRRQEPVDDRARFRRFLDTRASFVAQTSLYGYLRTRAGMRYPELFDDDPFVVGINVAKWQIWLACLGDLACYAGGVLMRESGRESDYIGRFMQEVVAEILDDTGVPEDAGEAFAEHAVLLRSRIAQCDWAAMTDDEGPFSESPGALVRWAPIVDKLKALDEPIVRNSVRFRWQEVRRDLRRNLDAVGVLAGP